MKRLRPVIKISIALSLAIVMSIAVFGCGLATKRVSGELPPEYKPDPSGKIRVQYLFGNTEAEKRSMNDWIGSFNSKYPKVSVSVEFNVSLDQVAAQVAAKTIGDVFFLDETKVYNYASVQKALMPLDHYVEAYGIDLDNIFSAIYGMGVCDGKLYMVMRDYNHMCLHYNRDYIYSANLEDPVELEARGEWTWDTFREYCRVLTTDPEVSDTDVVGASMPLGYAPVAVTFIEGWGGKYYDTVEKKVYFSSNDKVIEGLREMCDIVDEGIVRYEATDGGKMVRYGSRPDLSSYTPVFQSMVFISLGSAGKNYEQRGIDWDVVSTPATPTHKVGTGATGFVVSNITKNADAAAALCLSLYTEEGQRAYNGQEGGSVPNVRTLADQSFWRVPFADREDDPDYGKNYFAFISFPEADTYGRFECVLPPEIAQIVTAGIRDLVPNVVNNTMNLYDALEKIEKEANEKWDSIYDGG